MMLRVAALALLTLAACRPTLCEVSDDEPAPDWTFIVDAESPEWARAEIYAAIDDWKAKVPCGTFTVRDGSVADIFDEDDLPVRGTIEVGLGPTYNAVGRNRNSPSCGARAKVREPKNDHERQMWPRVIRHEIGHAFGLEHSTVDGVMVSGGSSLRVTDEDVRQYTQRWCQGPMS